MYGVKRFVFLYGRNVTLSKIAKLIVYVFGLGGYNRESPWSVKHVRT